MAHLQIAVVYCKISIFAYDTTIMNMERYIVGIGDALWDCLPEGRKLGGAPANFAYYMMLFGFDSLAVSAIGNDELGAEIKETFDKAGLKYMLQVTDISTPKM